MDEYDVGIPKEEDNVIPKVEDIKTFDNFDSGFNNQAKELKVVKSFLKNENRLLIIVGQPGCGKTHIVTAVYNQLKYKLGIDRTDMWRVGENVYYCQLHKAEKIHLIFNKWKDKDRETHGLIEKDILNSKLLIIDDLGSESDNRKLEDSILQRILDVHEGKIIITSNLKPSEINEVYGDRTFSRMIERSEWLNFSGLGKDYRRK